MSIQYMVQGFEPVTIGTDHESLPITTRPGLPPNDIVAFSTIRYRRFL